MECSDLQTLAIAGAFSIIPLQHPVSLLSTTLHPAEDDVESYPVFAPTCHPVPVITPVVDRDQLQCSSALEEVKLPKSFLSDPSRAIFLLQENRTGIEGLGSDVVPGFNNIWAGDRAVWGLSGVHPVSCSTTAEADRQVTANFSSVVYPHVTPPSWTDALSSLALAAPIDEDDDDDSVPPPERIPVVVVKGPKRSGKSSLARASLNRLLGDYERVAWLECDLGQGEFGCGGVVGLWLIDRPVLGELSNRPYRADPRPTIHTSPHACTGDVSRRVEPPALPRRVHGRDPAAPLLLPVRGAVPATLAAGRRQLAADGRRPARGEHTGLDEGAGRGAHACD